VSEGAKRWLANAEIGHDVANGVANKFEGFMISGCAQQVNKSKDSKYYILITSYST